MHVHITDINIVIIHFYSNQAYVYTVLNLIECIISVLKNTRFSGKGCQSLHIIL